MALIDTEGTFRPERIRPIAERFGVDADAVLNNVIFVRSPTSEHQMGKQATPRPPALPGCRAP